MADAADVMVNYFFGAGFFGAVIGVAFGMAFGATFGAAFGASFFTTGLITPAFMGITMVGAVKAEAAVMTYARARSFMVRTFASRSAAKLNNQ
jgi:polyferredoxin